MAILNQKRILNLIPKVSAPVTIHVSQGDVGTEIEFTLVKGDEVFVNPGNVSASVHGVREDGANFGPFTCTLSGSKVTFPLHSEMTAVKGSALAEIVLVDNSGNKVGSANFGILVEKSVFPLGVTYDNDVSVYESILAYVQTIPSQVTADYTSKINAVQNNLNAEINTRTSEDALINARIDEIIAPSGEAPSAAEVTDARIGEDGTVYDSLGTSIRTQVGAIKDSFNSSVISADNILLSFSIPQSGERKFVVAVDGTLAVSQLYNATDYIDISAFKKIKYKRTKSTSANPTPGMAFYNSNKEYISGIKSLPSQESNGYVFEIEEIPSGTAFARFSSYIDTGTYGEFQIYGIPELVRKVNNLEDETQIIETKVQNHSDILNSIIRETPIPYAELFGTHPMEWEYGSISASTGQNINANYRFRTKTAYLYSDIANMRGNLRSGFTLIPRIYDLNGQFKCVAKDITNSFVGSYFISEDAYYDVDWLANKEFIEAGAFLIRFLVKCTNADYDFKEYDIPFTFDEMFQDLQPYFDAGGNIILPPNSTLHIDTSMNVDISKVKCIDGNGSAIVVHGDITAFNILGSIQASSNPSDISNKILKREALFCIENIRIFSNTEGEGTGISFSGVFKANISNVLVAKMKVGFEFNNYCRDMIITNCHIYAMALYGFWFKSSLNFHQLNVTGCIINYAKYCLFYDECNGIANHQYSGNDFEISTYPSEQASYARCIYIKSGTETNDVFGEMEFSGNTIQGHTISDGIIDIDGTEHLIHQLAFIGNTISNALQYGISIKNVRSIVFSANTYGRLSDEVFKLGDGIVNCVISNETGHTEGGLLLVEDDSTINRLKVGNNIISGTTNKKAIDINSGIIDCLSISGNVFSGNNLSVDVNPTSASNSMVIDNICNGSYNIKAGIVASNNI